MATISHVLKLDVATIQGWLLFKGSIYCTEAVSVRLLFKFKNKNYGFKKGVGIDHYDKK